MTLLTDSWEPPSEHRRAAELKAEEVARLLLQWNLESYAEGSIGFEDMCRACRAALAVKAVPAHLRRQILGAVVAAALDANPPPGKRGNRKRATWLNRVCFELSTMVNEREGLPLKLLPSRRTDKSAFERTAEILQSHGVKNVTAVTVDRARAAHRKA